MPTSEDLHPLEKQNKEGGPLPARNGRENFLIQTSAKSTGHAGVGFASMRTHSTSAISSEHAGDGSASTRTFSTSVMSAGHAGDGPAPSGHARPDVSHVSLIEKPSEEV
eukprot:3714240-Karenia_brevis.AAC.1